MQVNIMALKNYLFPITSRSVDNSSKNLPFTNDS